MRSPIDGSLQAVLEHYSDRLDLSEVSVTRTCGFSGAGVWRLGTPAGDWAVRRWPTPGLPEARLRGLHRLLAHLRRQGLTTVAAPASTNTGETLVFDERSWWQVEPWLSGKADYHEQPTQVRLEAALRELARWHTAAAEFAPAVEHRTWFSSATEANPPAVEERIEALRKLTPSALSQMRQRIDHSLESDARGECQELGHRIQRLAPGVARELSMWRGRRFSLQPCLRDVWHDHVLFTGDAVTGLIDPSACRTEHAASDLSRLIGSLVEDDAAGWRTALDAYQSLRKLSLDEIGLVMVLDRSGVALGAWTWLTWIYDEHRRFDDPAKVLERLRYFRRRLRALEG